LATKGGTREVENYTSKLTLNVKKKKCLIQGDKFSGSCHKRQKQQAPTPQAPIRDNQTRKVANAKVLIRNSNLT